MKFELVPKYHILPTEVSIEEKMFFIDKKKGSPEQGILKYIERCLHK